MKRIRDIVGLLLICVKEGLEYGRIKDVLFDPGNGRIKYLIVDDGQWYLGAKLLPFDKIIGIGSDVITTHCQENIVPLAQVQDALDLIKQDVKVVGSRVYTQKGEYVGEVTECFVNEKDGSISACEITGKEQPVSLNASDIVTYGKNVIIISQDSVQESHSNDEGRNEQDNNEHNEEERSSKLFEIKQRRFLLGKKVTKRIYNESGQLLVDRGEIVTDDVIDSVKAGGKLVELTMNIKPK